MIGETVEVRGRRRGAESWISIAGELDIATAPRLDEAIAAVELGDAYTLVIDLSALDFLAAAGLRVIYEACRRWHRAGRQVVLIPGPSSVQRLFGLTGTDRTLPFVARTSERSHPVDRRGSRMPAETRS